MGGAIKMMEDLTHEERLKEQSTLCLGEKHPKGSSPRVCAGEHR